MKLLITGATGLIGKHICEICRNRSYEVNYLTTSQEKIKNKSNFHGFYWNPAQDKIDTSCIEGVDKIIHLAGANIVKPWTKSYREQIINSRIDSANLLYKLLSEEENEVTQFISASAIGIYPSSISHLYDESSTEKADDFLGKVVQKWEISADQFKHLGIGVSKIRIGLVLAQEGGFLQAIKKPINNYVGSCLGSGKQWQSWIHIEDLAHLFVYVAEEEQGGVFNAVAPQPVKQKNMVKSVAKYLDKPLFLPAIPESVLHLILGDRATMILASQLVQSKRLFNIGFTFKFHHLEKAIHDLL